MKESQHSLGGFRRFDLWPAAAFPLGLTAVLVAVSFWNYLLFHTLAEFFPIAVATLMWVVAWHTYNFSRNHFLMYLTNGYFWIAILDLAHALAHKGMATLLVADANPATQFWLAARYSQALILLSAPYFLDRPIHRTTNFLMFGGVAAVLCTLIASGTFPAAFVEGHGLTAFKIGSEYVIVLLLIGAIAYLIRRRALLDRRILLLILASLVLTIGAELAFTFYVSVYGFSNLVGHIFKLFSFWLIYIGIVRTVLTDPFTVMARGASSFDAVHDPIIVVDDKGLISNLNQAAIRRAGVPEDETLNRHCHDLFHPHETSSDTCEICRHIHAGRPLDPMPVHFAETDTWEEYSLSPIDTPWAQKGFVQVSRDITDRVQAEERLRESEARLRLMLENASFGFGIDLPDGRSIEPNPLLERMLGYTPQELLDMRFTEYTHPDYADLDAKLFKEMVDGERETYQLEKRYIRKDGQIAWGRVTRSKFFGRDGRLKYCLGMTEEITDRKRAEVALRESEARLRAIVDHSPALIMLKDIEGRYLLVNKEYEKHHGISAEEALGKTAYDLFPRVRADSISSVDRAVLESDEPMEFEDVDVAPDGTEIPVIAVKFPVHGPDGVMGVGCVAADITERKRTEETLRRSEERLSRIFQSSPALIAVARVEDGLLYDINDKWVTTLGFSREESIGRTSVELGIWVDPGDRKRLIETFDREGSVRERDVQFRTKGGEVRDFVFSWDKLDIEEGPALLAVLHDITERKQAEERLRQTQRTRALGVLAAGVAHELNNLLLPIQALSEMMLRQVAEGSREKKRLEKIVAASRRAAEIVGEIVAFSRQEDVEKTTLDLNEAVTAICGSLKESLPPHIRLEFVGDLDVGSILGDADQIETIVKNLISNSVDASGKEEGEIRVSLEKRKFGGNDLKDFPELQPGDYAVVLVADTGKGIEPGVLEFVFDPFFTTKEVGKGTGMGLAMVQGIAMAHDGAVRISSTPGVGTQVRVYLPLVR